MSRTSVDVSGDTDDQRPYGYDTIIIAFALNKSFVFHTIFKGNILILII